MTAPARRLHGPALVAGSALSGLLAYVFFAIATRALGPEAAAPVSVLWTWWSLAAAALTFPLQHWATRTVTAHHGEGAVRRDLPRVLQVAVVVALFSGGGTLLGREALFGRGDLIFPAMVTVVTLGAAVVGLVRGILVARRRLLAVATTLVLENLARVVIAIVLTGMGDAGAVAFGLALVAGQAMALSWPSAWRLDRVGEDLDRGTWIGFLGGAAGGQLLAQVVLNGGPAVLALVGGEPAEVTAFFAVLALFRAPYTLAVGAVAPVTGWLTRQVMEGRSRVVRTYVVAVTALTAAVAVLAVPVGMLVGPWMVRLVFGADVVVHHHVAALVASGSAVALGTLALSLLAMARGATARMTTVWIGAVVVAGLVLLASPTEPVVDVAVAFLAAEVTAYAGLGLVSRPAAAVSSPQ